MYQIRKFHGFLWASGGCFSDFLIHNIDECCWMKDAWPVSAKGSGGRALPGRLHRPELRHLLGRVHLRRRRQALPGRPEHRRLRPGVRQLRPRQQGLGGHLVKLAQPGRSRHLQGPEVHPQRRRVGVPPARAEPLPGRVGRPDPRHPQGQALQRGQARRRGQPRHLDGPDVRPYRPDHHVRRHAQLQERVRAGRGQAHHDQPRPDADG